MKILVFADSHTNVETMIKIAEREKADVIFHLGDHLDDALELEKQVDAPVHCVAGNTDTAEPDLYEKFVTIGGKCFLLMHGHQLQQTGEDMMSRGLRDMIAYGKKGGADIILFGHTHEPFIRGIREHEGNNHFIRQWIFNPGSIKPVTWTYCKASDKWNEHRFTASYGLIHLSEDTDNVRFEIVEINID